MELDDVLGGGPIQHREIQDHESQQFLDNFKSGEGNHAKAAKAAKAVQSRVAGMTRRVGVGAPGAPSRDGYSIRQNGCRVPRSLFYLLYLARNL